MWIHKQDADRLLKEFSDELSSGLDEKRQMIFETLSGGDDWSFVIKAAALIEATLTEAIVARIGDEKLQRFIEGLPVIGEHCSKVTLAKTLGLITSEQRRFIREVAELRYKLAHRINEIRFDFESYMSSFDANARRSWQDAVVWYPVGGKALEVWRKIATRDARVGLQMALFMLVSLLLIDQSDVEFSRKLNAVATRTSRQLLNELGND